MDQSSSSQTDATYIPLSQSPEDLEDDAPEQEQSSSSSCSIITEVCLVVAIAATLLILSVVNTVSPTPPANSNIVPTLIQQKLRSDTGSQPVPAVTTLGYNDNALQEICEEQVVRTLFAPGPDGDDNTEIPTPASFCYAFYQNVLKETELKPHTAVSPAKQKIINAMVNSGDCMKLQPDDLVSSLDDPDAFASGFCSRLNLVVDSSTHVKEIADDGNKDLRGVCQAQAIETLVQAEGAFTSKAIFCPAFYKQVIKTLTSETSVFSPAEDERFYRALDSGACLTMAEEDLALSLEDPDAFAANLCTAVLGL
ncbi:expressed unknown protein [Seminavis robusta]|uniref:Uncharacterized protein n=1 Tax=Seminavis robusta TaxID=568900 RepID=A0A9N8HCQ0_9STRA|nr:expressed unknown protein [Seminavis robusta]|eukprot:Sro311_g114360.1 n/a (310) ;mRNA; r:57146-58075